MQAQAQYVAPTGEVKFVSDRILGSGDIIQLADGRAAVKEGLRSDAGDIINFRTNGKFRIKRKSGVTFLPGQDVWWSREDGAATYALDGDFRLGPVVEQDAVSSGDSVLVDINAPRSTAIELLVNEWEYQQTDGLGVTTLGGALQLSFDAVAEVAQAAVVSKETVAIGDGPIFEAEVAIYDIGDNAALDIDIGLAKSAHATDFESVDEFVAIHLDGASLDIKAHSDDGDTDVAPVDTTKDAVDDTYFFVQIDASDPTNVKIYINGERVLSATNFTLEKAEGPLKAVMMIAKTSDDTTADVRVKNVRVYRTPQLFAAA